MSEVATDTGTARGALDAFTSRRVCAVAELLSDDAPPGDHWHVIEQICFVRGTTRIETIDLACSGFLPLPSDPPTKEPPR